MSRTDTVSRAMDASPTDIYAALVDPDALLAWLPPDGMSGRFDRFDASPGGGYRLVLTYLDAATAHGKATEDSDVVEARFVELVPGVRVVQAVDFVSDDPANAGTMTMTWELVPEGRGTRVEIRADNVPAGISPEDHAVGMTSSLDNLAAYLSTP
ncbi:MAG: SRPBCC family protein [Humibacter sp.]